MVTTDGKEYEISTDAARVDVEAVHAYLTTSYWAAGIPRDVVAKAIANSLSPRAPAGLRSATLAEVMMDRALLVALTLVPSVPALFRFRRSVRERTARWSRSIIVWGALTIVAGVALYSYVAVSVFAEVARAAPADKSDVLASGLARGSPALTAGLIVGALLCVAGGITRSVFSPPPERKGRPKAPK